jgi:hypothetical protein
MIYGPSAKFGQIYIPLRIARQHIHGQSFANPTRDSALISRNYCCSTCWGHKELNRLCHAIHPTRSRSRGLSVHPHSSHAIVTPSMASNARASLCSFGR